MLFRHAACAGLMLAAAASSAAEPAWTRLVADDTVAVVAAPLDADAWRPVMDAAAPLLGADGQAVQGMNQAAASVLTTLRGHGARDAALLLRLSDFRSDRGFVIAVGFDREPPAAAARLLQELADELHRQPNVEFPVKPLVVGKLVLLGGQASLTRYAARYGHSPPAERPELTDALKAVSEQGRAAVVAAIDNDSRRVVRELWPAPAEPFADATGDLLADGLRSVVLSLSLEEIELELAATARDAESAARLRRLLETARNHLVVQMVQQANRTGDADARFITEIASSVNRFVEVEQEANRLAARIGWNDPRTRLLIDKLKGAWSESRDNASRAERMNQFKRIALAMHNHHDRNGQFPAAAGFVDEQRKPLLSWRVALLPYLEAGPLYDRFHLDEPWNSPHNLQLLDQMPGVFADPGRPDLAAAGKTTYQVPVGAETLFLPPGEAPFKQSKPGGPRLGLGHSFRQLIDGTSNTLMVVEVEPGRAVPWTKPADWEVDPADPLAGLRSAGEMVTGWADGHAASLDTKRLNTDEFRKVLTRAGRESVDYHRLTAPDPPEAVLPP